MELLGFVGREYWPAAGKVVGEHAGGEDRHSPSLRGDRADQKGPAEDEEGLDLHAGDALDQLLLRIGLLEHSRVDAVDPDLAGMALGLDGEDAPWPDKDVVDVAVAERDVVECHPAVDSQIGESPPHLALSLCATRPAADLRAVPAVGCDHRSDCCEPDE